MKIPSFKTYMYVTNSPLRENFDGKVPGLQNGGLTLRGQILRCAGALQGHKQVIKQAYLVGG